MVNEIGIKISNDELDKAPKTLKQDILNWIKIEPHSITDLLRRIAGRHEIRMFKQSVRRNFLDNLIKEKHISYISRGKNKILQKKRIELLKYAFKKKWDSQAKKYYFYTPRSRDFYIDLLNEIEKFSDKEGKLKKRINKIIVLFSLLELFGKFESGRTFNNRRIKAIYLSKDKKLSKEEIEIAKQNALTKILFISNAKIRIGVNQKDGIIKDEEGNVYLKIAPEHPVNFNKLSRFLGLPFKRMSHSMAYIAKKEGIDRKLFFDPMMQELTWLFVEMER